MAIGIDMFGTGGEGLGGLFVGNQLAMDRDKAMMDQQKGLADIASSQAMTRQRELTNQLDEALLPGKIEDAALARSQKQEADKVAKFNASGEQFGKLGMTLGGIPAAARPAALRQMAASAGIGDDNPMLNMFMNMDPEQMPDAMAKFSQGFFEQGDKARVEAQKRGLMMEQKRAELEAKAAEGEANRQMRRDIAADANALRRDIAAMTQAGQDRRASAKGAGKPASAQKLTTDQAIAASIMNNPELSDQEKLEALQRYQYNKATLGKPGTEEQIMGTKTPEERVESAITKGRKGGAEAPTTGGTDIAAAVKKAGQQYEPDKFEYRVTPDGRVQKRPK